MAYAKCNAVMHHRSLRYVTKKAPNSINITDRSHGLG